MIAGRTMPRWGDALAMGVVVLIGTLFACRWALDVDNWRVMTDELLYVKVAQSFGENLSLRPEFRDVAVSNYSVLYPLLLAPLIGLLDFATAFRLAHVLGAFLLASTAVPTYLVARYATRSRAAGLAAAVPVALAPSLLYSLNLMTEALAAPLVMWTVWAYVRSVDEASLGRDVAAIAITVALVLTRTQFIFMPVLLPVAIVIHEVGMRLAGRSPRAWAVQTAQGLKASVVSHPLFVAPTVIGALLLMLITSTGTLVGDYSVVVTTDLVPPGFREALFSHVTLIAFGVGAVPLVLTLAFVADALWRPDDRRLHALAVCLLLVLPAMAAVATSFDLRFSSVLQERYLFYAAPLLLVGAACFVASARRPLPTAAGAAIVAAVLIAGSKGLLPVGDTSVFASPARQGWVPVDGYVYRVGGMVGLRDIDPVYVLAAATVLAGLAIAWLVRSGRRSLTLAGVGIGLSLWCGLLTSYAGPKVLSEHEALAMVGLSGNLPLDQRAWIDRAVGQRADVGIAPTPIAGRDGKPTPKGGVTDPSVWWEAEFRNHAVRSSYVLEGMRDWTPYAHRPMTLNRDTGALRVTGREAPYVVEATNTQSYSLAGAEVARTRDLRLLRPARPYRAAWATRGLSAVGELVSGSEAEVSVYGSRSGGPRRARVSLTLVGQTLKKPLTVRGGGASESTRVFGRKRIKRTVCAPARGAGTVRLKVQGANNLRLIGVRVRMGGPC